EWLLRRNHRGFLAMGQPPPRHTRAHARETGTMYGNNPPVERAARRLRSASETARNFAFSSGGREAPAAQQQAHEGREIGVLGGSTGLLLVGTQSEALEQTCACVNRLRRAGMGSIGRLVLPLNLEAERHPPLYRPETGRRQIANRLWRM